MSNKIDDSAAGMPLTPATAFVASMNLMNRKEPPMACCPRCSEPLISTLKYAGAEFFCVCCRGHFGFLAPTPKTVTPELQARHDELERQFYAEDEII